MAEEEMKKSGGQVTRESMTVEQLIDRATEHNPTLRGDIGAGEVSLEDLEYVLKKYAPKSGGEPQFGTWDYDKARAMLGDNWLLDVWFAWTILNTADDAPEENDSENPESTTGEA